MHYLDALTLAQVVPDFDDLRLIDVGAGAGFPGLPLAIAFPALQVTLMDARAKKLRSSARPAPNSANEHPRLHARAEDAGRDRRQRETYDIVVARALGRMPVVAEYTCPSAKAGGQVIASREILPLTNAMRPRPRSTLWAVNSSPLKRSSCQRWITRATSSSSIK